MPGSNDSLLRKRGAAMEFHDASVKRRRAFPESGRRKTALYFDGIDRRLVETEM